MKKPPAKQRKISALDCSLGLTFLLVALGLLFLLPERTNVPDYPLSRRVLEVAEREIRASKPAPTESARQYAYIAAAYADSLKTGDQSQALYAGFVFIKQFNPKSTTQLDQDQKQLVKTYHLRGITGDSGVSGGVRTIVGDYRTRNQSDGHDLIWDGVTPVGPGKWVKTKPIDPFTPRAGEWRRWYASADIAVTPPPVLGSPEDLNEIATVRQASAGRTGEDVNIINFWGGTPGTNTPSGIWQDQLYKTIAADLPKHSQKKADATYADIQKQLALTLSDAFMACWKVKFTYWTARPDMRTGGIITAMPDPYFPGYVSGHSTISKAASDVLSVLVPEHATAWEAMAVEARNSRLVAGIHFDVDNRVGFTLGTEVARQIIEKAQLAREL